MHNSSQSNHAEQAALIHILSRLHDWEMEHSPMLRSVSGRQLYFSFAQRALVAGLSPAVKEVITARQITDRALRSRLQTLVSQGYFKVERNLGADRRTRALLPSDEMSSHIEAHIETFRRLLQEQYMLIERENTPYQPMSPTPMGQHNYSQLDGSNN